MLLRKKFVILVLSITLVSLSFGMNGSFPVFAETEGQQLEKEYSYKIVTEGINRYSYVYDKDNKLLAESVFNLESGKLTTVDHETGDRFVEMINVEESSDDYDGSRMLSGKALAKSKYKKISTHSGTLKITKYTVVAVAAAIGAVTGGAGAAAITAVATKIVADKCDKVKYTVTLYGYNEGKTYHYKRVFKFYNKSTNKKLGPNITTYNTTHK
ncbi:hypothetical protein [Hornefia butyriciproducens]|uniref:hypothetical protein n=1 Tax=Hornefia butyriciproducens TaxID=2652293 RepID=UPI0023F45E04|nr:hypothetical protein [Hornefia butyriciproducens]MDD6298780.1 hypothetical protein [Hornefia butyriciproducens]